MLTAVQEAFDRVFDRHVLLREDTPLASFGVWNEYAVLIATAVQESTGAVYTDQQLASATTVGDLMFTVGEQAT